MLGCIVGVKPVSAGGSAAESRALRRKMVDVSESAKAVSVSCYYCFDPTETVV